MSEQELPKCTFCGAELEEGLEYQHPYGTLKSYLCTPCYQLLGAFVRDQITRVLKDIDLEPKLKMKTFKEKEET